MLITGKSLLRVSLHEVPEDAQPLRVVPPEGVVVAVRARAVDQLLPGDAAAVDVAAPLVHAVHGRRVVLGAAAPHLLHPPAMSLFWGRGGPSRVQNTCVGSHYTVTT